MLRASSTTLIYASVFGPSLKYLKRVSLGVSALVTLFTTWWLVIDQKKVGGTSVLGLTGLGQLPLPSESILALLTSSSILTTLSLHGLLRNMCICINLNTTTTTSRDATSRDTTTNAGFSVATTTGQQKVVRGKDRLLLVTLDLAGREKKKEITLEKLRLLQNKGTNWRIWLQQRENGEKWWVLRERKEKPELWQEILSKIQ